MSFEMFDPELTQNMRVAAFKVAEVKRDLIIFYCCTRISRHCLLAFVMYIFHAAGAEFEKSENSIKKIHPCVICMQMLVPEVATKIAEKVTSSGRFEKTLPSVMMSPQN